MRLEKRASTCAASFSRRRPLSTKMHVRRSPMARWTSSAATVESTPPLTPAYHPAPGADPVADSRGRLVGERGHRPVAAAAADPDGEIGEDARAVLGVRDLGVKQQGVEAARGIGHACDRCVGAGGDDGEPRRRRVHHVAVAGPHPYLARNAVEQAARLPHRHRGVSVLAFRSMTDVAAEGGGHRLHAVADAEHRNTAREDRGIAPRRAGIRQARRPTRQDDAGRAAGPDGLPGGAERHDLRIDGQLAKTTGDELRVLGAEIENQNGLMGHEYTMPEPAVGERIRFAGRSAGSPRLPLL